MLRDFLKQAALSAALAASAAPALAAGLQVAPVSISIPASQNAEALWLSNTGDAVIHAQVRAYRWSQPAGKDELDPARDLVVSPPMLEIKPGAKQLVRVIRTGAPPNGTGAVEGAYRLAIDELPIDVQRTSGLQFVLHYSVPVFTEPTGGVKVAPQLHWKLVNESGHAALEVANGGSGHAQLADLSYTGADGKKAKINGGLLGYVLPGATMRWTLKEPPAQFAGTGTFAVRINAAPETQTVTLDGGR